MKCKLPVESLEGSWKERPSCYCVFPNTYLYESIVATENIFITIFLSLNSTFSLVQERHNCSILAFVIASSHITNVHVTEIVI